LAISAAAKVAELKKVDFPVIGFPTTPSKREYDLCKQQSLCNIVVINMAILFALESSVYIGFYIAAKGSLLVQG